MRRVAGEVLALARGQRSRLDARRSSRAARAAPFDAALRRRRAKHDRPRSPIPRELSGWTGEGGPSRPDGERVGRHDERAPPPPICSVCARRFCACREKPIVAPVLPGAEDCCQSSPQCKFCVWTVYEDDLAKYRRHLFAKEEKKAAEEGTAA